MRVLRDTVCEEGADVRWLVCVPFSDVIENKLRLGLMQQFNGERPE